MPDNTTERRSPLASLASRLWPALAIALLSLVVFPVPAGVAVQGLIVGLLGSLVAVGMALLYRANRILNFAQTDLGTAPTVLAVSLAVYSGVNYVLAVTVGLIGAVLLGSLVELVVIRRFFRAPRLILTVATIGLGELLAVGAFFIPAIWGMTPQAIQLHVPFTIRFTIEPIVFSADHVVAVIVAPLALLAVAALLRFTSVGVAIRASAERADRASLLGVPVKGLQTVVWSIATLLSFIGLFLRAGILGLPVLSTFSLEALLAALAAIMLGNFVDLPATTAAAVALGLLEAGIVWNHPRHPELVDPIFAVVIVVCLLARRVGRSRAELDETSTWQLADEVRPVPRELRSLAPVRAVHWGASALVVALLMAMPHLLGPGDAEKATAVVIFVIITISVTVLTGWAGQVSLAQMSFVAFGATTGAYATQHWHLDLSLAMLLAGGVGALVAVIVGLPALRLRGLFLAATTLAFALATSSYLLNVEHFGWIPTGRVTRPKLFGAFGLDSQAAFYYLCLASLAVVVLAVRGIHASRTGRVLRALRDNERAAQAFGVNLTRAKLTAFAISGFLAALGGCLLVHLLHSFASSTYEPGQSFVVFTSAVVGGLGSLLGAALGALFLKGGEWFLPGPEWQALTTSAGVLIVLWLVPGGLADIVYRVRDAWLRWLAQRRGILVPSLVADRRADPPADPLAMIVAAPVEAAASSASTEPGAPTDPVVPTAPGVRAP